MCTSSTRVLSTSTEARWRVDMRQDAVYCTFGHDHIEHAQTCSGHTNKQTHKHTNYSINVDSDVLPHIKNAKKVIDMYIAAHSVLVGGEREYACTCVFPQFF